MKKLFVLSVAVVLVAAAQQRGDSLENPVAGDPGAIENGRKTYVSSCGGCHGTTGEGGRGPNLRDGRLIRRSSDEQMYRTIQKGVAGTDMPGSNLPETRLWELVAFVRALGSPAAMVKSPGDAAKGERIYASNGCANCHAVSGRGGAIGPDLTNVGGTRSYESIRESILKPDERIAPGYQKVSVKTKDGRSLNGVMKSYSNYDVQFTDRDGKLYIFETAQLSDVQLSMSTFMPGDYGKKISREEMVDLLAYLSKLSLRPMDLKQTKRGRDRR